MELYSLKPLFGAADERNCAIGAFNVNFYAQALGIIEGLIRADAPGILQASRGANKFQGGAENIILMIENASKALNAKVPLCVHLDHGDKESCMRCIIGGYSSVMIDASTVKDEKGERKSELKDNIKATLEIARIAHKKGVSVEGEIGVLAGREDEKEAEKTIFPTPEEVYVYARATGIDGVAIVCGTSHGPIKEYKGMNFDVLEKSYQSYLRNNMKTRNVLHGSSTVPKKLVGEYLSSGGIFKKEARGVPIGDIKKAIAIGGVRKVNIDTDLRIGITTEARRYIFHPLNKSAVESSTPLKMMKEVLEKNPETVDPRDYLKQIMDWNPSYIREDYIKIGDIGYYELMDKIRERVARHVKYLMNEFGSSGLAGKVNKSDKIAK